jgi:hypothetical protein
MTRYVPYDPGASEVDQPETTGHTYHDDFGNAWVSVPDAGDDDYDSYKAPQANPKARREAEATRAAAEAAQAVRRAARARQQAWAERVLGVLVVLLFAGVGAAGGVVGALVGGGIVVLVMAVTGYGRGSHPDVEREP